MRVLRVNVNTEVHNNSSIPVLEIAYREYRKQPNAQQNLRLIRSKDSLYTTESLILAQDERWRHA